MASLRKGTAHGLNSIWEQNTKTDLKKTGWKALDWIHVCQTRSVGSHKHSDEHSRSKRSREFVNCLRTIQSARTTPLME